MRFGHTLRLNFNHLRIFHAVYAGHQAARELGAAPIQPDDKRRERMVNELKMVTP